MTTQRIIAITGATGFVGSALVERLLGTCQVRALVRTPGAIVRQWAARGCEVVVGDLDAPERVLATLVAGADVVYHCAARMAKDDAVASHRVNVAGTERLARAALDAAVRRFMYVSSISVYAATQSPTGVITETVSPEDVARLNHYGRTKYEGELRVRALSRTQGLEYTIFRPTNIYGPGSGPWFHQFERLLRRLPVALGDIPIDVVYVDDVVDAMVRAATCDAAANETFHIGHEVLPLRGFIRRVGDVTGRRVRMLPRPADRAVRRIIDTAYRALTRRHMSMSLVRPVSYPSGKARAVFGYAPRVRLDEGFRRLTRWYAGRCARSPRRVQIMTASRSTTTLLLATALLASSRAAAHVPHVPPARSGPDTALVRAIPVSSAESLSVAITGFGRPIVLIPGLFGSAFAFRNVTAALVDSGYRTVVIEPLGVGRSSRPRHADYSLTAQARRIAAVMDSLALRDAVIVAHSIAGSMAFRLALERPDLVAALVSIEGGPAESAVTPAFRFAMRFASLLSHAGPGLMRHQVHRNLKASSGDPSWVTDEIVDGYTEYAARDLGATLNAFRGMAEAQEPARLAPRLSAIGCRVVLLLGGAEHKGSVDPDELRVLEQEVVNLAIERIPTAGHFIFEEHPDAVIDVIRTAARAVESETIAVRRPPMP